ncbi:MAG: DUF4271 domain-containing protein [Sphingobacteriales bacterium]|nr:MAG: DUF4271 domain-containing protein [Sphingobacteriales bacterium]
MLTAACFTANDAAAVNQYGVEIPEQVIMAKTDSLYQSRMSALPFFSPKVEVIRQVEKVYEAENKTASFYLVLLLLLTLGILRMAFPSYFRYLYNSFMSPMSNKRALREQIEQNTAANAAMNIFFCISLGLFVYVIVAQRTDVLKTSQITPNLFLIGSILLSGLIYFIKLVILKFIGWAFKMEQATNDYLYNVFLINKILGVALLPFSIILAFGTGNWLNLIFIVAIALSIILLFNRYTRSWSSLGSFFQFSKFHFFMYFCASELLPLAILAKFTYNILV